MGRLKTRKCHKCKHTLKSKNFVQFKNGKPICDIYKTGIPDEIFFKARYCKNFELANKYNIVEMLDNFMKKLRGCKECEKKPKVSEKKSRVISINKDAK
ncbi:MULTISPECIES: hypothetical protein [Paraclostridium]|uniref:Uncharacterized protein n=1 Tax=Paraclostridium benzoelyticum TaxID=1629550 RepID=A0A0M3DHL1_9FIRM|nr:MULTISPECIES: hypothetical protein [Paraclostridium]KKY00877.1 hypothetical protein VN21_11600 [Paraclostridium benzoelyticum]MCU9814674.1 hypothetical protein [Paraclostridium sp. AKS73]OXX82863.1 hypothetical protein AVM15_15675 [Paraclostridium benzoelyticum]